VNIEVLSSNAFEQSPLNFNIILLIFVDDSRKTCTLRFFIEVSKSSKPFPAWWSQEEYSWKSMVIFVPNVLWSFHRHPGWNWKFFWLPVPRLCIWTRVWSFLYIMQRRVNINRLVWRYILFILRSHVTRSINEVACAAFTLSVTYHSNRQIRSGPSSEFITTFTCHVQPITISTLDWDNIPS